MTDRRPALALLLLLAAAILIPACTKSSSAPKPNTQAIIVATGVGPRIVPTIPPLVQATPPPIATPRINAQGTPVGIRLDAPNLWAHDGANKLKAATNDSMWMLENGLAIGDQAKTIVVPKSNLAVANGDTLTFEWTDQNSASDTTLQQMQLAIYSAAANVRTTNTVSGQAQVFDANAAPPIGDRVNLDKSTPTWTASNLKPGQYYLDIAADWSNPYHAEVPRYCHYIFLIQVS